MRLFGKGKEAGGGQAREKEPSVKRTLDLDPALDLDPVLEQTLRDFRLSMHALSEAKFVSREAARSQARTTNAVHTRAVEGRIWRLAAGWTLATVVAAGAVSGGLYERARVQEQARIAAEQQAARQRLAAEQKARAEDEMLALVDKEVSRQVPSAMEPMVELIESGSSQ